MKNHSFSRPVSPFCENLNPPNASVIVLETLNGMYACFSASMMPSNAPIAVLELIENWSVRPKLASLQDLPKSQKINLLRPQTV